ncbi:MAG: lysylphosphatidylglycerol synthase transmembrane domain-containing protein [Thermoanaerobaculia bacterium]
MATRSKHQPNGVEAPREEERPWHSHPAAKRALRLALLLAGLALIVWILRAVGWPGIASNLARIGVGWFVGLSALCGLAHLAFVMGWWLVIDPRLPLPALPGLFAAYLAGGAANYLTPVRVAGEPLKAHLVGGRTGTGPAVASLTIHKHADLLAQWLFISLGVCLALWRFALPLAARLVALAGVVGLGAALLLMTWALRRGAYSPILRQLSRWKALGRRLERYQAPAQALDTRIRDFYVTHPSRFLAATALCFLGWCGGWLETYLLLRLLSHSPAWGTALAIEALAAAFNNMLTFVPGRVGSAEGVRVGVFVLLGLPAAQGAACSLVRRGRELVWVLPGLLVIVKSQAGRLRAAPSAPKLNKLAGEESRP